MVFLGFGGVFFSGFCMFINGLSGVQEGKRKLLFPGCLIHTTATLIPVEEIFPVHPLVPHPVGMEFISSPGAKGIKDDFSEVPANLGLPL